MFQKMKGADMFQKGNDKSFKYVPFGVIETNTPNAMTRLDLGTPDFSGIQMMQYVEQI
jgi:hypothetical protein